MLGFRESISLTQKKKDYIKKNKNFKVKIDALKCGFSQFSLYNKFYNFSLHFYLFYRNIKFFYHFLFVSFPFNCKTAKAKKEI